MNRFRAARNTLIVAVTVSVVLVILYRIWGQPDSKNSRLAYFREHRDEFNILFAGSSISMRNVDPLRFDATVSERGFESHSFNLGMGGADMHQINWAIRAALRMQPRNLKYVIIDLRPFEWDVPEQYRLTPPAIRWHDPHETRSAMRSAEMADAPSFAKEEARRRHLQHFIFKYLPVGMMVAPLIEGEEEDFDRAHRGHEPYVTDDEKVLRKHREFMESLPEYLAGVERKRRHEYGAFDLRYYNLEALREQIDLIRASGATPIYWTPVSTDDYDFVEALNRAQHLPVYLRFDDAERYGQLYDAELRMDQFHLNNEGTQLFSPMLAGAFLEHFGGSPDLPATVPVQPPPPAPQ